MKAKSIKQIAVIAAVALFTAGMTTGCATKKVTRTDYTRTTVLDDDDAPLKPWVNCTVCDGKGTCKRCNGTGKVQNQNCITCNGTGKCSVCAGEGGYRSE